MNAPESGKLENLDPRQWAHLLRHESGHHQGWNVERFLGTMGMSGQWSGGIPTKIFVQSGKLSLPNVRLDDGQRLMLGSEDRQRADRREYDFPAIGTENSLEVITARCLFHLAWPRSEDLSLTMFPAEG